MCGEEKVGEAKLPNVERCDLKPTPTNIHGSRDARVSFRPTSAGGRMSVAPAFGRQN